MALLFQLQLLHYLHTYTSHSQMRSSYICMYLESTVSSQSLRSLFAVSSQSLRSLFAVSSQSLRSLFAVSSQSLRSLFAVSSQSLRSLFAVSLQSLSLQSLVMLITSFFWMSCILPSLLLSLSTFCLH